MRKFAFALAAVAAIVLGFGGIANAYPPGGPSVTVSSPTVGPGDAVTISANCTAGEMVTFTLESSSTTSTCDTGTAQSAVAGTAVGTVTAPSTAGTFVGTVNGTVSGPLGTFAVAVAGATPPTSGGTNGVAGTGGLPATGSSGTNLTLMLGLGALVVGGGLFGVSQVRRRQILSA